MADITRIIKWSVMIGLILIFMSTPAFTGGGHGHKSSGSAADHPHEDEPANVVTQYNGVTELFLEFPPMVVGETSTYVTHFTTLEDFKPVTKGSLDVVLSQNNKTVARFRVRAPARQGIFLPDVLPQKAGVFNLRLELSTGQINSTHELGLITVYQDKQQATVELEADDGEITYLKEQQWINPYAAAKASVIQLSPSVPGFATVSPPLNEYSTLRAAEDGYYQSDQYLTAGSAVETGTVLGRLIPLLGEDSDVGDLIIERQKSKSEYELAKVDLQRLKKLIETGAVSEKIYLQAQKDMQDAQVEFNTSQSRLNQRTSGQGESGFIIRSPISGAILETYVLPGSFVREGDPMFSMAGINHQWLKIRVPEHYGSAVQQTSGVWFEHNDQLVKLIAHQNARLVNTSKQVSHPSRTIETVLEYPSELWSSVLGSRLAVNVFVGAPQSTLSIPVSSVIDDGGIPVVYVQLSGESFERRVVSLGIRDGAHVEVTSGLSAGEWVVSTGAYYVKLASASGDAIGHGHAH